MTSYSEPGSTPSRDEEHHQHNICGEESPKVGSSVFLVRQGVDGTPFNRTLRSEVGHTYVGRPNLELTTDKVYPPSAQT